MKLKLNSVHEKVVFNVENISWNLSNDSSYGSPNIIEELLNPYYQFWDSLWSILL